MSDLVRYHQHVSFLVVRVNSLYTVEARFKDEMVWCTDASLTKEEAFQFIGRKMYQLNGCEGRLALIKVYTRDKQLKEPHGPRRPFDPSSIKWGGKNED